MLLKPHVAAILNAMAEAGRPGLHELSPTDARAGYQLMHAELTKVKLAKVENAERQRTDSNIPTFFRA